MKTKPITYLNFEIDKLTRSIENVITGDSFPTEVSIVTKADLMHVTKKNGWRFNWRQEFDTNDREVYKLTILNNPTVIQGLVSLKFEPAHVYMPLIESAPFNIGKSKIYLGIPGNLVAFACKLSFQRGGDGFVSFHSKTVLIDHYAKSLGAYHFGGHLMIIDTNATKNLIDKYFKS
ncbi:MAG: hypothetical protein A3H98_00575 [Bacteroidetes bacterium RIFCSPLOWO2_02_FULL_36_8]|nr:MAG: hypothetical protein A3H98_00575 [Bacteroidetes bacterium RIFCSPLOWO2_02_FULL_36_8]OFY69456.1 MAG: hypothetical protein A3G23_00645 [Bacteroidetes bacterium RIFCSPLOWO2_12_FULL_37_12]